MASPTKTNVQTLDYSYRGSPWVRVGAKSGIDLDGLDYSYQGSPWWGIEDGGASSSSTSSSSTTSSTSSSTTSSSSETSSSTSSTITSSSSSTTITSSSSSSSTTSSTSSSSYSLPPLEPCTGELAFGEQNPAAGEIPISWKTWDDGSAGVVTVTGDADWGQLTIVEGEEGRSQVYDLGAIPVGSMRILTLTENRYGSGSGTATLQIRGDTSTFNQDDGEPPIWQNYTAAFVTDWRYVQTREIKP